MKPVTNLKNIRGKGVLVRVDFNVPIERGKVADDTKMTVAVPTIQFLMKKGAKVVLMTHVGRPAAQLATRNSKLEISSIVDRLEELLKKEVQLIEKWDFEQIRVVVKKMEGGEVLMLPNLRLHPGEEKNSPSFAGELAELGQIYVNEAFGVDHRAHASLIGVPKVLPSYAGLQLIKEVEVLGRVLYTPQAPLVVLMGGAKLDDKVAMVKMMVKRATKVLIGTALANSFFKAAGYGVGASLTDPEGVSVAKALLTSKKIVLPKDVVVGAVDEANAQVVEVSEKKSVICEKPYAILDIGPRTILDFAGFIKSAKTLIWNGPVGRYELKRFSHGTLALGRLFAARSHGKAFGVIGGGETIDAMRRTGMLEHVDFVSTGGGAMLEFLGGKRLPGIEALHNTERHG